MRASLILRIRRPTLPVLWYDEDDIKVFATGVASVAATTAGLTFALVADHPGMAASAGVIGVLSTVSIFGGHFYGLRDGAKCWLVIGCLVGGSLGVIGGAAYVGGRLGRSYREWRNKD